MPGRQNRGRSWDGGGRDACPEFSRDQVCCPRLIPRSKARAEDSNARAASGFKYPLAPWIRELLPRTFPRSISPIAGGPAAISPNWSVCASWSAVFTRNPHQLHLLKMAVLGILVPVSNAKLRSEEHTSELQSRFDLVC